MTNGWNVLVTVLTVIVLLETVWDIFKPLWKPEKREKQNLIQVFGFKFVCIGFAISFSFDIFAELGLHAGYPYVGYVLTGLVISRGSNIFHDKFKPFNLIPQQNAPVQYPQYQYPSQPIEYPEQNHDGGYIGY